MITRQQALTANMFHGACTAKRPERWRRNGSTQTWKTRPDEFRVPIKFGMYDYGQIWNFQADQYHMPEDCPFGHTP